MADLNTSAILLATLPLLADLTGIGLWVHFAWGATVPQGLLAGVMLAPLGEGLVLPLMHELRGEGSRREVAEPRHDDDEAEDPRGGEPARRLGQ